MVGLSHRAAARRWGRLLAGVGRTAADQRHGAEGGPAVADRHGGPGAGRSIRRARPVRRRVQRSRRQAAGGAADPPPVHGRRVARAANAGVGRPHGRRGGAQPRSPVRSRVPRSAGRSSAISRGVLAGWSRTCWCWRAPTPAAVRFGESISISMNWSPSAGARWRSWRSSAASRSNRVRAPEIPFRGDEDLLRQLVVNLLQNAVQHTPSGGAVTITLCREGGVVRIRVRDTGAGIPAADRERIFDRFVQLDPARRGRGAGLGLPIARWIAEAHGGTLALEASGPTGSTFCVTLPERT